MFGTYRLILAMLVALTHFGFQYHHAGFGSPAVVSFYMLSGVLMQRQFAKFQSRGPGAGTVFLVDRFLRVAPIYWAVSLLVLFTAGGENLVQNFALLPLNYQAFTGATPLIFTAWSLANELHFYILLPLLALCSSRAIRTIMWLSLCVFVAGPFLPQPTWWSYEGWPGTFFVFMAGMLYARGESLRSLFIAAALLLAVFVAAVIAHAPVHLGINVHVCVGMLAVLMILPRLDRLPQRPWDTHLGALSFPLFLCHPWVMQFTGWKNVAALALASLLVSAAFALAVEWPSDRFRYWARRRVQPAHDARLAHPGTRRA